jgi:hypothetical protein
MKNSVIAEYEKFLEFFIELGRDIDITNTFDIPENQFKNIFRNSEGMLKAI